MTQAVCFKCGEIKRGAFCLCPKCNATPQSDAELAVSLAMTDHYFDLDSLKQMGESVRQNGKPPALEPETRKNFLELVREGRNMLPGLGGRSNTPVAGSGDHSPQKPWWRFW